MKGFRLGGRQLAPGEGTEALTRERESAKHLTSQEQFQPLICQCCGYRQPDGAVPCLCDGLPWYLQSDGRLECQAHRFARAIDGGKRKFFDFGRGK